jgi:putative SOS response-associated peptidase YedK
LRDSVIGDGETLALRQTFFQTSYDLSGAPQSKGNCVSEDFPLSHALVEHKENKNSSHYILSVFREAVTKSRRQEDYRMCGRFTVKATWAELVALYRLTMDAPPHNLRPRYNVCPTDPVDVVTAERQLVTMRWGLVPWWWSKPLKELRMATFNARAETVETKAVFRDAFKRSRCLIPLSGYYEWQSTPEGKQPWYFTSRDGSLLLTAAGLWDEWKNRETGERLKSCTIIVTEPNAFAAEIHDRMPVFLTQEQFAPWLSGEAGAEVLKPAPDNYLQRWPVSKRVNSSKADADDPTLIEPVELVAA